MIMNVHENTVKFNNKIQLLVLMMEIFSRPGYRHLVHPLTHFAVQDIGVDKKKDF